jgi:ABC-2 type transport system permease protein
MSATAQTPPLTSNRRKPHPSTERLAFSGLIRSEWLKLRTLRSTWITLAFAVLVLILAAALIGNHLHGRLGNPRPLNDPGDANVLTAPLRGFGLTQLVIGVLGVLAVTGEYATGMIRATFTAVPRRLPVLWAKLIVFAALAGVAMLVAAFAAFFTAQQLLGSYGIDLRAPHALRVVLALAGYLTLVGLLGLGLGFITRSTAGGIAALVGLLLVAPGILAAINTSWSTSSAHYLPLNAGLAMFSDSAAKGGDLTPSGGTLTMITWTLAAVLAAAVMITQRDT